MIFQSGTACTPTSAHAADKGFGPAVLGAEPHRLGFPSGARRILFLRARKDSPGFSAGLPNTRTPAAPERKDAVGLLIAVRGAAGEVKMHAVLRRLGIGDRHEAQASGRVLVGHGDDLVLPLGQDLPARRLRPGTGPGRAGRERRHDVAESDGISAVCAARWTLSGNPLFCRGRADHGGHATR